MLALPQGAAEMGPMASLPPVAITGWPGRNGGQVRGRGDGAHARAAAAVGDAEGLVQVDVADVGADVRRAAQADLGVQVGAVHVHLAAVAVDDRRRSS